MNEEIFREPQGKGSVCFPSAAEYPFLSPLTMSLRSLLWFHDDHSAQPSPEPPKMFILSFENVFKFSTLWAKGQPQFSGHRLEPHELLMIGFDSKVATQVVFKKHSNKKKFFIFRIKFLKQKKMKTGCFPGSKF